MSVLKIRDENGKVWEIPALRGRKGDDGKTAYQYALDGGYNGTEVEFAAKLAKEIPDAYTLTTASETVKGGVKVGEGLSMEGETLNAEVTKEDIDALSEEKADHFTVGDGLTMSEDRVLSAVGGGESSTPEELFSVTLAETANKVIMPLKRPAKHMFVFVYPPNDYASDFLVYLSAQNCENLETAKSGTTYITDGTNVTQNTLNDNRFMCKIDCDGGLISAFWGVVSAQYQSSGNGYKFLNPAIKSLNPEGLEVLEIASNVAGKEFPAGATIKVIGV